MDWTAEKCPWSLQPPAIEIEQRYEKVALWIDGAKKRFEFVKEEEEEEDTLLTWDGDSMVSTEAAIGESERVEKE